MALNFDHREKISLSGEWQISFTSASKDEPCNWVDSDSPNNSGGPVIVPGIWNLSYPNQEGIGTYYKRFEIPTDWSGGVILQKFVGACYRTDVWLNRSYLGSHEGGYTPFSFDATAAACPGGENELVVRVMALSKTEAVDGLLLRQCPASKQSWHYTYGGLWGEVYLERCPWVACEALDLIPNLHRETVDCDISVVNRSERFQTVLLTRAIIDPKGKEINRQCEELHIAPGRTQYHYVIPLHHPMPWTCETPYLYRAEVSISNPAENDDLAIATFGMRDFTVHNGRFFLNGEPIFLKGVLLQPNYPITLVTPPDPEMMTREITLAKEAGFNLIRVHVRPSAPGFLDRTDQLGILVYAESSLAWIRESARFNEHGQRELREMIARDRNHPSVVFWGVYNENPPAAAANGKELSNYVRALDPTRVIVNNSGSSLTVDQDFGWIDRAEVIPNRSITPEFIQDIHVYLGGLISDPIYDWLANLGNGNSSSTLVKEGYGTDAVLEEFDRESRSYGGHIFVSELGFGGMTDLDDTVARYGDRLHLQDASELETYRASLHEGFAKRQLERVYGSIRQFYIQAQELQAQADTRQLEALLNNPRISGYVLTQLDDVSWECHGGMLDMWRNPKPVFSALQRLNQPFCLILRTQQPAVYSGTNFDLEISMICRHMPLQSGRLTLSVIGPQEETVFQESFEVSISQGINYLGRYSFLTGQGVGYYRVEGMLQRGNNEIARSVKNVFVLDRPEWGETAPKVSVWGRVPKALADHFAEMTRQDEMPVCLIAEPAELSKADWKDLLTITSSGVTTILGDLNPNHPPDGSVLAEWGIQCQIHASVGSWVGCYHWISDSELFTGLPTRQLADELYRNVSPHYSLSEMGGKVVAGAVRNTQTLQAPPAMLWYSDIEYVPFGQGRLIFCQYRIFDPLSSDPVAECMLYNLVRWAQQSERL